MLYLDNVCKSYGDKTALRSLSVALEEGVHGILGVNGAGKSTLLKIITGNLKPDRGSVKLDDGLPIRNYVGYMPQQQVLYDEFTCREFLWYMASLKGINRPKEEIEDLLLQVNLTADAKRKLKTFSGGMKQRALLAQALLGNPRLLVLDEPTAGLDPVERIRFRNYIGEISSHKIVLYATHVVSDIELIARRILILREGCLCGNHDVEAWRREVEGKVFEVSCDDAQFAVYQEKFLITGLNRYGDNLTVRLLSDSEVMGGVPVRPCLEDAFLYVQKHEI